MFRSLLTVAALSIAAAIPAQTRFLSARMTGDQETPPVTTNAVGWAVVRVDTSTNRVEVFAHSRGLTATSAHIHQAPVGAPGGIILPLSGGPRTWTGAGTLSAAQITAMLAGDTYVNLHTAANPGGEIRGQILESQSRRFTAVLDGGQANPPNASNGSGVMTAFLHEPDRVLTYELDVNGVNGNAAHLHRGAPGVPGPIVVPLHGGGQRWCGVSDRLSASDLQDLLGGLWYANVHTNAFPGGEIRGQLLLDEADFEASLDGAQETPPVVTNAAGEASVFLNPDRTVSYVVRTQGLTATAAHFHRGAAGAPGPVVFPLSGGPTDWSGTTPVLTPAQVADLRGGLWYVNVHTAANPGGEIRGQVLAAELPVTYGGGCPLGTTTSPEIGAGGAACLGASFDVTLFGAPATRPAVLLIGLSRTGSPALGSLPLSLQRLGMPDCFLLHDNVLAATATTDGQGCADTSLPIPFVPGLQFTLFAQWFVIAPGANPLGVVASNGLSFPLN